MGTQRQMEILERLAAGLTLPGDVERLQDVGWTMTDASLCGLGQTAAGAVLSAIKLWPALFEVGGPESARTLGARPRKAASPRPRNVVAKKAAARKSAARRIPRASKTIATTKNPKKARRR